MAPISKNGIAALDQALRDRLIQRIENVVVFPRPNTVRTWFNTTQPTLPAVSVLGEREDARYPRPVRDFKVELFSPPKTEHAFELGGGDNRLPQGQRLFLNIVAPATEHVTLNPKPAVHEVAFSTLRRSATVRLEYLHVILSGDGTSPGDLHFAAGLYDGERGSSVASAFTSKGSAFSGEYITLHHSFQVESAPDSLTLYARLLDDDTSDFPAGGFTLPGLGAPVSLTSGGDSSGTYDEGDWVQSWATVNVALPTDAIEGWSQRRVLQALVGDVRFEVGFLVEARVWNPYEDAIPRPSRSKRLKRGRSVTDGMGTIGGVFSSGGHGHFLAVGAEGALLARHSPPPASGERSSGWRPIGAAWSGRVALASDSGGQVYALAIDDRGAVRHRSWSESRPPEPDSEWASLGGQMVGAPLALSTSSGLIVVAKGVDGNVYAARLGQAGGRAVWSNLGRCPGATLELTGSESSGVHLFSRTDSGKIFHKRYTGRSWSPSQARWLHLGEIGDGVLLTSAGGDGGLALVTIDAEGSTRWKDWRDGRWAPGQMEWESGGSIHELLDAIDAAERS